MHSLSPFFEGLEHTVTHRLYDSVVMLRPSVSSSLDTGISWMDVHAKKNASLVIGWQKVMGVNLHMYITKILTAFIIVNYIIFNSKIYPNLTHAHTHVCTHTCAHAHTHAYIHVHTCERAHTHTHSCKVKVLVISSVISHYTKSASNTQHCI